MSKDRVDQALDALDDLLFLAKSSVRHIKSQKRMTQKAVKEFGDAIGGLFSPSSTQTEGTKADGENVIVTEIKPGT